MRVVTIKELKEKSINSIIDENKRFTISINEDEQSIKEEEETKDVRDKITILREECFRKSDSNS